jgi:hypothetical protein
MSPEIWTVTLGLCLLSVEFPGDQFSADANLDVRWEAPPPVAWHNHQDREISRVPYWEIIYHQDK